ncbi:L-type lectin-domain containing receptor kinase IX.2 isoform X2 [Brachypodium distachyon]|uniref:L-type lectin-domain containing receptor kinase IX.2 isoform X2 n=1 Tax=Brachypodium distachyon TaxID=15368 RepID=UPI0006E47BE8|nr:L-type lectin-domain containing receptor kinase IX.2 isoform X2 [Brachypodium distachyon]|eukprot:XP_024315153.1 L-type lectin-domain containing receptor kinase IX.2 isoform X2 [Brachypodium distachyon]
MFVASSGRCPSVQLLLLYAGCFLLGILPFDAPRHAAVAPPVSFSFDFSDSSTFNPQDLRLQGNAKHGLDGKLVDLTCNSIASIQNCTGRMSYAHPVPFYDDATGVVASFATRFAFRVILPAQGSRVKKGDGMAFFLTGYNSAIPPDSDGGGLDLMNRGLGLAYGADRFVAVEFHTYNNSFDPQDSWDHVGIDLSSVKNRANGNVTSLPTFSLNGTMTASISFNGSTRRLVASLHFDDRPSVQPVEVSAQLPEPITALLPPDVEVGFSASTGKQVELHQILSWSFSSTEKRGRDSLMAGAGQRRFRYRDLVNATDNFSEKRKLGKGAFGAVYLGTSLKGQEGQVAIKKIFKGSLGGPNNFLDEIKTISKTKHKNLVSLEGWCCCSSGTWNLMCWCCQKQDHHKIFLVYELVPQGNLHDHLHKEDTVLPWHTRDIKPENILLDNDYNAKLADFGLSRIANHNNATVVTDAVGTRGYMDPQCMKAGKVRFNRSTDVYSFGIVLLEIACKCDKSREGVWNLYSNEVAEHMVEAAADERLGGNFDRAQMHRVLVLGLWCTLPDGTQRPSMQDAMRLLEHDNTPLPDLASPAGGSST